MSKEKNQKQSDDLLKEYRILFQQSRADEIGSLSIELINLARSPYSEDRIKRFMGLINEIHSVSWAALHEFTKVGVAK